MGYALLDVNSSQNHVAQYGYDTVNRLTSAAAMGTSTYNLTFGYTADGSNGNYGNMSCVTNGQTHGLCPNYTFNASTNHINTSGFTYDAAGHLTSDGTNSYTWDAEGRLLTMNGGTTANITYNALGQRVDNNDASATYNAAGQLLSDGGYNLIPWGNVYLAAYTSHTLFEHHNALGSTTHVTLETGVLNQDSTYYPWGQSWKLIGSSDDATFATMVPLTTATGAETTTTLNRNYSQSYGRWLSPDPLGQGAADPSNPQTWNMYAYVTNSPTSLTDPTGLTEYCSDWITDAECEGPPPAPGCGFGDWGDFCFPPPGVGPGSVTPWPNIPFPGGPNGRIGQNLPGGSSAPCTINDDPIQCGTFPWWVITGGIPPFIIYTTGWGKPSAPRAAVPATGGGLLGTLGQFFRGRPPGMSFGACVGQNFNLVYNGTTSTSINHAVASGSTGIVGSVLTFVNVGGNSLAWWLPTVAGFLAQAPSALTAYAVIVTEPIVAIGAGGALGMFLGSAANCASEGVAP